jgi:hypothetical protein
VLSDDFKELKKELVDFRLETSKFMAQISTQLGFFKWIGMFFSGILVALVAGAVTITWNASAMNSELKEQGRRIEQLSKGLEQQGRRLEQQGTRLEQQGTRLEQLSNGWETIMERLDRIDRRLEALGARPDDDATRKLTQSGD